MNDITFLEALSITLQVFGKIIWNFSPGLLLVGAYAGVTYAVDRLDAKASK